MAYPRRILAMKTGADACQASAAAMRLRASAADRGVCLIGMACARAAFAESRRSTSAKYDAAFFSDIPATYDAISASTIIMTGDCTVASHVGGRSYSNTGTAFLPPKNISSLFGQGFHSKAGNRKVYRSVNHSPALRHSVAPNGSQPVSCAPVASHVWGAA